jgi:hypothetical protein
VGFCARGIPLAPFGLQVGRWDVLWVWIFWTQVPEDMVGADGEEDEATSCYGELWGVRRRLWEI